VDLPRLSRAAGAAVDGGAAEADGRPWTDGLALVSYGRRIGVRTAGIGLLDRVVERLPPGWCRGTSPLVERLYSLALEGDDPDGARACRLWVDGVERAGPVAPEPVLDALESDLQLFVAEMARRRVFVHAGVVARNDGAILIPGRSQTGKTTLVAELVRAGACYYSDEYAVLDGWGRVHPYPRRLAIRGADGQTVRCAPETLEAETGVRPLPVRLVVVTSYRAGARWRPRCLSPGEGVLALIAHTVSVRRAPARALRALQRVARGAPVVASERGEAAHVAPALLGLCAEATGAAPRRRVPGSG
jgi:hypothetical protein